MTGPKPPDAWRSLRQPRRGARRLLSEPLAETDVTTPDGETYIVRAYRTAPVSLPSPVSDPISTTVGFVRDNLSSLGQAGWAIKVITPETTVRGERVLFTQRVDAHAIVVDVGMAVAEALRRGDRLWDE